MINLKQKAVGLQLQLVRQLLIVGMGKLSNVKRRIPTPSHLPPLPKSCSSSSLVWSGPASQSLHAGLRVGDDLRMFLFLACVAGLAVCLLAAPWCRRYARFRRMELALPGPPSLPVLGNALSMLSINEDNILDVVQRLAKSGSPELSRFSVLNQLFLCVNDPELIGKASTPIPNMAEASASIY